MKATRDTVSVGTILIHRDGNPMEDFWFTGRTIKITSIRDNWYGYKTIGDDNGKPDSDDPYNNEFLASGIKDFDVCQSSREKSEVVLIGEKVLRLKDIRRKIIELQSEELCLKNEIGFPW